MSSTRSMLLGAFFMFVLGTLGYYTLFMTEFSLFKKSYEAVVHFPDANGLRTGDSVRVAGLRTGRVRKIVFDKDAPLDRRITVTVKMDSPLELRQGFTIAIQDSTLLGGKVVVIDPGPAGAPVVADTRDLAGVVASNALSAIGNLVTENSAKITRIVDNFDVVVADLKDGKGALPRLLHDEELAASLKDGVAKFQKTADNLATLSDDVKAGKGTIGRLFADEELSKKVGEVIDRLTSISNDLQSVSKDLAEGKGTLGRLFKDEKLADDVAKAVESIRSTFDKIQSGEGAFSTLINDPQLAADLKAAIAKIGQVADDLSVASDAIRNAKGSIGKLIMDDGLYEQIQRALKTVTAGLEEYRESAPITAFTSVLFSVF